MSSFELNRELRELKNERLLNEKILKLEKDRFAQMLKGDLGKDMTEVLSGKKFVKLSFKEKFKYKIKNFFDIIFNIL